MMRLVFMGSPEFAVPSLRALVEAGHSVQMVICQSDKPSGRGRKVSPCAAKGASDTLGLPVVCPDKVRGKSARPFIDSVEELEPDFIVVAAYGKILSTRLLKIPKFAPINVHASLLPRWRGASPIHHAILAGDKETGVCIMQMEAGLDTGGVYQRVSEPILPDDTTGSLLRRLADAGAKALCESLPKIADGSLTAEPQQGEPTFAPILRKQDGRLDFSENAQSVNNRIRAMNPWPSAHTTLSGQMLKVFCASVQSGINEKPGTVLAVDNQLVVACGSDAIAISELQLAGKKRCNAKDFLRGARVAVGDLIGE